MNELSIPFTIPNLKEIQTELLSAIDYDYKKVVGTHAFSYTYTHMIENCPKFMEWLMPKVKAPIRVFRYYITPPHTSLDAHIDGVDPTSPFGINIPVTGTQNTYHCFYDTPKDNIYATSPNGYLGSWLAKDQSKLKLIGEEIEDPFGQDENDIPMDTITNIIRHNVYEILVPNLVQSKA
jgi:hypothetical protein